MENYPPEWANYFEAAEWAGDNTPKDCIIVDRKGGLFGTVSLRRCIGFPLTYDKEAIIESFYSNKVDYVVVSTIPYGSIGSYLVPAVKEYIDRFKPVFSIDNPPTYIFQFDKSGKIPE